MVDINNKEKDNDCNKKISMALFKVHWCVCLPSLHSLIFFFLSWAHVLTIFVSAMIWTLTLYCCYCILECNNVRLFVDRSSVLAAFMTITGFSDAKNILMILPKKNYFYNEFSHNYFDGSSFIKWIKKWKKLGWIY